MAQGADHGMSGNSTFRERSDGFSAPMSEYYSITESKHRRDKMYALPVPELAPVLLPRSWLALCGLAGLAKPELGKEHVSLLTQRCLRPAFPQGHVTKVRGHELRGV